MEINHIALENNLTGKGIGNMLYPCISISSVSHSLVGDKTSAVSIFELPYGSFSKNPKKYISLCEEENGYIQTLSLKKNGTIYIYIKDYIATTENGLPRIKILASGSTFQKELIVTIGELSTGHDYSHI